MTGNYSQSVSSSTTVWRVALLVLTVVLGLTNLVELAATFRPDYWDHVGLIGNSDFGKADSIALIAAVRAAGGTTVAEARVPIDHSWSDHRIALESLVINWPQSLPTRQ